MWRIKTTKDGIWLGRWILHSATQFHPFSTLPWDDQYPLFPGMTNTLYTIPPLIKVPESYIGKVPVQGRTTKDGVWLGPRVASGSERVASVLKNFRNYVANKDHQGWRLARSLDITLGHPIPPFLYPSLSGGPDSLNRISASLSGTSAGVTLPRGAAVR